MQDEVDRRERAHWAAQDATWALWEVMRTATDVGHAVARRMELPYNDVRALELLTEAPDGMGTVDLGNRLGIRSASAAEMVDRLESAGHVERHPHPTDRRRVVVELTAWGRDNALTLLGPLLARYDRVAAALGENATVVTNYLRAVAEEQRTFCRED
ncbi:MAG: MarR family transcriptional regulator [Pseudonocardiaceae bacterium]|nr:MarR family transcriptional regulator [Pseudonocardiaceae bacterium]